MSERPNYASADHPIIAAAIEGTYRFANVDQARAAIENICNTYTVSKVEEGERENPNEAKLWIRGYALTPKMKKEGYTGNFAKIRVMPHEKKFTLETTLVNVEHKFHPQRKRKKQRHPNWGHPMLRNIKKGATFETPEQAQNVLAKLHEEYPEVTIPLTGKLYIMIYQKPDPGQPPVKKWVFELKNKEDGSFYLEATENQYEKKKTSVEAQAVEKVAAKPKAKSDAPVGKFTSDVMLKRAKKKKQPVKIKPLADVMAESDAEDAAAAEAASQ